VSMLSFACLCIAYVCGSRGWVQDQQGGGRASLATAWDWSGHRFAPLSTNANKGVILERRVSPHTFIFRALYITLCIFLLCRLIIEYMNVLLLSGLLACLKTILSYILTYMVVAQYYSLLYL
jgi:hypothetical protein